MKNAVLVLALAALVAVPSLAGPKTNRQKFVIDEYDFNWYVAKEGDFQVVVKKDQDKLQIVLRNSESFGGSLYLDADEAVKIGEALAQTNKQYGELKAKGGDVNSRVETGEHAVSFSITKKSGFFVSIKSNESFSMDTLIIDKKSAQALSSHLKKSKEMVEFVDKRISP